MTLFEACNFKVRRTTLSVSLQLRYVRERHASPFFFFPNALVERAVSSLLIINMHRVAQCDPAQLSHVLRCDNYMPRAANVSKRTASLTDGYQNLQNVRMYNAPNLCSTVS